MPLSLLDQLPHYYVELHVSLAQPDNQVIKGLPEAHPRTCQCAWKLISHYPRAGPTDHYLMNIAQHQTDLRQHTCADGHCWRMRAFPPSVYVSKDLELNQLHWDCIEYGSTSHLLLCCTPRCRLEQDSEAVEYGFPYTTFVQIRVESL
ncbi:hypothetical protein E6O75_ATG10973 [Venturia nashicola]|uniref:Uncharacterized protein n=1 Tax=Venturia nashicola TaxID=86259 RepID=A0A4Z1P6C4_9PEZI|nr:hypothetical protein E6O75_ATG10973 [Venturia nashicola]